MQFEDVAKMRIGERKELGDELVVQKLTGDVIKVSRQPHSMNYRHLSLDEFAAFLIRYNKGVGG